MNNLGYIAFLRGINVGGNNLIKMAELKICLEKAGIEDVKTYIQSGNVLFKSDETDSVKLSKKIETAIESIFKINVGVAVFSDKRWKTIIKNAPSNWGKDPAWKHNLFILLEPFNMDDVVKAIGEPRAGIEFITAGDGILYQSTSFKEFGKTTTSKLPGTPIYKRMTIRNYNTSVKLLALLES